MFTEFVLNDITLSRWHLKLGAKRKRSPQSEDEEGWLWKMRVTKIEVFTKELQGDTELNSAWQTLCFITLKSKVIPACPESDYFMNYFLAKASLTTLIEVCYSLRSERYSFILEIPDKPEWPFFLSFQHPPAPANLFKKKSYPP